MKKRLFIFILFLLLQIKYVKAACPLEDQVAANNAAGAVNAVASRLEYTYDNYDEEHDEQQQVTAYTGMIYVYNLTKDIYFDIANDNGKETYTYADDVDGAIAISTGSMAVVKNYTISIYSSNKDCGASPIRTIDLTLPRYNPFFGYLSCRDYPDYYYCGQFLNADLITETDFMNGLDEYAKTHKKEDEKRREGIIANTIQFIKKYWYLLIIIIVVIIIITVGIKKYREEKRKKEVV